MKMVNNKEPKGITIGRSFFSYGDFKRASWIGLPFIITFVWMALTSSYLIALKAFGIVFLAVLFIGFCVHKACNIEDD